MVAINFNLTKSRNFMDEKFSTPDVGGIEVVTRVFCHPRTINIDNNLYPLIKVIPLNRSYSIKRP